MRTRRRSLPEPVLDSDDSQSDDEPLPPARKRQRKTKAQLAAEAAAAAEAAEAPGTAAVASALRAQAVLGEPEPAGEPKPGTDADGGDASSSSSGEGEGEAVQPPPTPQQAITAAQKEASRAETTPTKRMCASRARDTFHLTERELDLLEDVKECRNPHYRCAAPMRLYLVHELQALSANKAARKAWDKAHAAERAAATAAAFKAKKAAAAAEAAAALARMGGAKASKACQERYGSVSLPESCLERIMTHLATLLEPGGLRGPSHVAGVIGNASLVCWDFYHAAKAGWAALASEAAKLTVPAPPAAYQSSKKASPDKYAKQVQLQVLFALPGPADTFPGGWDWWDKAVSCPAALTLPQLKAAARHFKQQVTGTKAELILRVLAGFGLRAPSAAPVQLLRALGLERAAGVGYVAWEGPYAAWGGTESLVHRLAAAGNPVCERAKRELCAAGHASWPDDAGSSCSLASARAVLLRGGFAGMPDIEAAGPAADAEIARRRAEAQARAQAEEEARHERSRQEAARRKQLAMEQQAARAANLQAHFANGLPPGQPGQRACSNPGCRNRPSPTCSRGCCGWCCALVGAALPQPAPPCTRHRC